MALSMANAASLKPEIKLAQALSEFKAVLSAEEKTKLHTYHGQSPPTSTDVMRFTAEIDRDATRNRRSRQCFGTRLTNVLHAVQQFSSVVDPMVGISQSQIAAAIWGTVKMSIQLASAISTYFDHLSTLFMKIGRTCPRYQDFGLLYPESARLQSALYEYFIAIVRLCTQAVLFLKKRFWSQLSSSILKPFESVFGTFQRDLEDLSSTIRDEVLLASNQAQIIEAKERSRFRVLASTRKIGDSKKKRMKAELQFLNACSVYDHEQSWKQARKRGNTNWICHDAGYKEWKQETISSTLWCTGILGSGKTVLSANVVEDLKITTSAAVSYFFCRHDEAISLETRTILGSIARQIFEHTKSDIADAIAEVKHDTIDIDQILDYLQELLPSDSRKYFIVIDGLDECEEKDTRLLLQCLKQLLESKHSFQVYCSSRADVYRWAQLLLEPRWNISMQQTSVDIEEYVEKTLVNRLESGSLSVGDLTIVLTIQDVLLEKAHGMFLWVVFQIDSICSQNTDEDILKALEDLPKDLPDTFNRILRKLQHSNAAGPQNCKKIFDLVAAAQRPLTIDELREAVSVKPGETSWDASKLVNDMTRLLLDSCGSLIVIDEEQLTVHFAHHSVKKHFLSEPLDSDMRKYHVNMKEADLYLGDTIVTYLNLGVLDRQLTQAKSTAVSEVEIHPSAILGGSLSRSNIARLAVRALKSRGESKFDVYSQLKTTAEMIRRSEEKTQSAHPFLPYAQEYWLFHTKAFHPAQVAGYALWQRLIGGEVGTVELPWASKKSQDARDEYLEWIVQNKHWALINQTLVTFTEDHGASVNTWIGDYGTALQTASYCNNKEIARLLLENGADVEVVDGSNHTALQIASSQGHEEIARLLLKNGANVNRESGSYGSALHAASYCNHAETAKLLLENGANVNAVSGYYSTALQAASLQGHEEMVKLLLENGADVNKKSGNYGTALQAASSCNHKNMARLLLENGADVDAVSGDYGTTLQVASFCNQINMARLLLENGANVNAVSGAHGTALQAASCRNQKDMARLLLYNGADVNVEGGRYGTALQAASYYNHAEMVRLLLGKGANVNAVGGDYGTALQAASYCNQKNMARLLLENGADVNVEGGRYGTALQAASYCNHAEMVRLLLGKGANVNAVSGDYGTALQAASYCNQKNMARLLLENGADVNVEGGLYGTALQAASYCNHAKMTSLLLKNGAIANQETMKTALSWGSLEVQEVIRKALESQSISVGS